MKSRKEKNQLGQFMTPQSIADFMANLLCFDQYGEVSLLDAGAGKGSLTDAVIKRLKTSNVLNQLQITHFDIDKALSENLMDKYGNRENIDYELVIGDFLEQASKYIEGGQTLYTHAIQNPPYKKIKSNSKDRKHLRNAGIETVNLYSGFIALTLLLLKDQGELVAIIPRSFCNGSYYKPFRELIYKTASIDRIHLFNSRSKPFKEEKVLQESVIIKFSKRNQQGTVGVSHSSDDTFDDLEMREYGFDEIVRVDDQEKFIHIPNDEYDQTIDDYKEHLVGLSALNIKVSTGPVVDFRLKEHLILMPEAESVPLIYPGHFKKHVLNWPQKDFKKPNAMLNNENTKKWFYGSNDTYVVVNRFSTKDEKKRVIANVLECDQFESEYIGIENHLNVYHIAKNGLPRKVAYGLMAFLNSTLVDNYVRIFNGHTQINVTDLKNLKYPCLDTLELLGEAFLKNRNISDEELNRKVVALIE